MKLLVLTTILLTLIYNIVLVKRNKGIPPSLSHSFYVFGGNPGGYVFYGYLVAMFAMLIVPMIEATPEKWEFLPFLALASLCFVGAAADFLEEKQTRTVHVLSAIVAAALSVLWCVAVGYWFIPLVLAVVVAYPIYKNPINKIYWLEIGCFVSVFITLIKLL